MSQCHIFSPRPTLILHHLSFFILGLLGRFFLDDEVTRLTSFLGEGQDGVDIFHPNGFQYRKCFVGCRSVTLFIPIFPTGKTDYRGHQTTSVDHGRTFHFIQVKKD